MKQFLTSLAVFAFLFGNATIRTVSNSPSTIAQFNTIQAAVNASSSGDSIYVHGSPNQYAAFTLTDKALTIIGPGWSPNKNLPLTAVVQGCTISGGSSSGTEIQGLVFVSNSVTIATGGAINNLRFIRNQFSNISVDFACCSGGTYTGYLFEGNMFDNGDVRARPEATYQNFLFQNNYFYENACCRDGNISGFNNSINVMFNHNLWFGPSSGARNCFSNSTGTNRFLSVNNNIFVRRDAANQNSSSTFQNNITFNAGVNTPWASNGNVDGGGNVANQDPQMVDQTSVNNGVDNALLNFTIAAGPANNSASDGKDMGLLYDIIGSLNWTTSRNSRLPYIFSMNIVNPTIAAGGSLTVQVEARKNN